jgi:hypothetical protein
VIGAGQVWPIASAWVDGIAVGLKKNSPPMRAIINSPLSANSPLKTMASGRLPKTSGFQVDSAGIGLDAGRVSRGREAPAFISQNAPST